MARAEQIGFVGIGNMGAPMVRCLLQAKHAVAIFDADAKAMAPFRDTAGVRIAPSLPVLAAQCATIITMLPDSKIVRRVVLGTRGSQIGRAHV